MRRPIEVIDEIVAAHELTYTELAARIGADSSVFSKMKMGSELDFARLVRVFEVFYVESALQHELIMAQVRPKNIISALEYATIIRDFALLDKLLTVQSSREVEEAQAVYHLFRQFRTYKLSVPESLKKLEEMKVTRPKSSIVYRLFMVILKWHVNDSQAQLKGIHDLQQEMRAISCEFMRDALLSRLDEFLVFSALHIECDTEKVKRFFERGVAMSYRCLRPRQTTVYTYATSLLFSDYEQSLAYFIKYCAMINIDPAICTDIQFLKVYWGRATIDELTDLSEQAHWYAKQGECEKALRILDEIEPSPFRTYYRALATKEAKYLVQALMEFVTRQEFFYARVLLAAGDEFGEIVSYIEHALQYGQKKNYIRNS